MAKPWYRGPWPKLRLMVLARDGYECQVKSPVCIGIASEADHIRRVGQGGAWWDLRNLRASCKPCNTAWNRTPPARTW